MISLFKPCYDSREADAVSDVLQSGWVGLGPRTEEFEHRFAARVGAKHAVALNSCTSALHMALRLLDVGPGDEVIVPTITFVSTAHAVVYCGAVPVFCDVNPRTLLIDVEEMRRLTTSRTRAVIPVLYAGQLFDCPLAGIPLVYDCAHAAGSAFSAAGKFACWSFHAVKNLACGDGGMLTMDDALLAQRARKLRWLGIDKTTWDRTGRKRYAWEYDCREIGFKSHTNDLAAAIGLVQLQKLDAMQQRRREIADRYCRRLKGIIELPPKSTGQSWHLFVVRSDKRNALADYLARRGITTGVHYKPIHLYECYGQQPTLSVAEREWHRILSLPMHAGLTDGEVDTVCETIKGFFG
jgi:perosamine synthetase